MSTIAANTCAVCQGPMSFSGGCLCGQNVSLYASTEEIREARQRHSDAEQDRRREAARYDRYRRGH